MVGTFNNKRIIKLDLLKIFSIYGIVFMHVVGHGGILENLNSFNFKYFISWFFEILFYPSVNIFAILTGYLTWNKPNNVKKIFSIIKKYIYIILINVFVFLIVSKESPNLNYFSGILNSNWYFMSYLGLLVFKPLLDSFIENSKKDEVRNFLYLSLLIATLSTLLSRIKYVDILSLNLGYSSIWLSLMYLIGAFFKKYPLESFNENILNIGIFFIPVVHLLIKSSVEIYLYIFKNNIYSFRLLMRNTSPFAFLPAIFIFLKITIKENDINITNKHAIKTITFISSISLYIYLWHDNFYFRNYFLTDNFVNLLHLNNFMFMFYIFLIPLLIIFTFSFVEMCFNKFLIKNNSLSLEKGSHGK